MNPSQQSTATSSSQSSTSVWASSFSDQSKVDSSSPWSSSTSSESGWATSAPMRTAAGGSSVTVSSSSPSLSSAANTSSTSSGVLGWAATSSQVPSQVQNGLVNSTSAQTSNVEAARTSSSDNYGDGSMWQSLASGLSLSNLQKQQSPDAESSWSTIQSTGSNAMASSISITNTSPTDGALKGGEWGRTSAWGASSDPPRPDSDGPVGWGTPEPLVNPGTEGWGQPENKSWSGESGRPSGWSQESKPSWNNKSVGGGWADTDTKSWGAATDSRTPAAWGAAVDDKASSQWGAATPTQQQPPVQQTSQPASQLSQPPSQLPQQQSQLSQPSSQPPSQLSQPPSQLSQTQSTHPSQQQSQPSQWGSQQQQPVSGHGVWGAPRPIAPPSQQVPAAQPPSRGLPAASGNTSTSPLPTPPLCPLPNRDPYMSDLVTNNEGWGKRPIRQDTAWDLSESPKTPRRTFSTSSGMGGGGGGGGGGGSSSSSSSGEDSHWHQPNDGTAIWESSKDSGSFPGGMERGGPDRVGPAAAAAASGNPGASSSGARWGRDNDSGHWNGPPGTESDPNTWNGPPKEWGARRNSTGSRGSWSDNPNEAGDGPGSYNRGEKQWNSEKPQWGLGGGGGGATGEWNSNKTDNYPGVRKDWEPGQGGPMPGSKDWESRKDDNVWDRNGTNVWGEPGKTETGTWNRPPQRAGSWEEMDNARDHWASNQRPPPGRDAEFWDSSKPKNWNTSIQPPMPSGQRPDIPGSWGGQQTHKPGWVEPGTNKMEEGHMWNQAGPPVGKGGWSENQLSSQWPGAGTKPPRPTSSGGWTDSPDMNPPIGAGMLPRRGGHYGGSGGGGIMMKPALHMRRDLLQQLMEMGFKKEDAQKALIGNNMIYENALAELLATGRRPDLDMDASKGRQVRGLGGDDMVRRDQMLPPLQNTTFSQSNPVMPGSQPPMMALGKQAGLQSSMVPGMVSATMQQRILQQQQLAAAVNKQVPPQSSQQMLTAQGQLRGSQPAPTASVQQHLIQQQIVQQLQMAVQAGLISPQLLNQQLSPNMLVMLQQLLQLQQVLTRLVQQQQVMQQGRGAGVRSTQLDQLTVTIQKIKEQIHQQQQQINQAQQDLRKQSSHTTQPPTAVPSPAPQPPSAPLSAPLSDKDVKELPSEMASMQIRGDVARSRLNQWKLPSPEGGPSEQLGEESSLNKAPGSKPIQSSHSSPNLQEATTMPFSDSTWSTGATPQGTASWPSASSDPEATKDKEDSSSTCSSLAASISAPGKEDSSSDKGEDDPSASLDIVEFVPGKLWQGTNNQRTTEDDPFLTPGDIKRSFSVSTVKEDYISSTLGTKASSSSPSPSTEAWSSAISRPNTKSSWSMGDSGALSGDLWGGARRPPPGLDKRSVPAGNWQQPTSQAQAFHRSVSWAPGDRGPRNQPGSWGTTAGTSAWVMLKNIPAQLDAATLKAVCGQSGLQVQFFQQLPGSGQAIVNFRSKEEGGKAQKSLNDYMLGGNRLVAECISEGEVARLAELARGPPASMTSIWSSTPSPPQRPQSSMWSTGSGAGSNMWGAPSLDEASQNSLLPGDLLGGQ